MAFPPMKVYPEAKMLKSFSPKENDLFSRFARAQHHGKCSGQPPISSCAGEYAAFRMWAERCQDSESRVSCEN
jgi:hypothetical protein